MKKSLLKLALIVAAPVAVVLFASCGDTCETKQADVKEIPPSCTFGPDAEATITVTLCGACSETSPTCEVEIVNDAVELNTVFRECAANKSCTAAACDSSKISCKFRTPKVAKTYDVTAPKSGGVTWNTKLVVDAASSATTCTL